MTMRLVDVTFDSSQLWYIFETVDNVREFKKKHLQIVLVHYFDHIF